MQSTVRIVTPCMDSLLPWLLHGKRVGMIDAHVYTLLLSLLNKNAQLLINYEFGRIRWKLLWMHKNKIINWSWTGHYFEAWVYEWWTAEDLLQSCWLFFFLNHCFFTDIFLNLEYDNILEGLQQIYGLVIVLLWWIYWCFFTYICL